MTDSGIVARVDRFVGHLGTGRGSLADADGRITPPA